jgi:fructose/tagatose bisphosphate aldolase
LPAPKYIVAPGFSDEQIEQVREIIKQEIAKMNIDDIAQKLAKKIREQRYGIGM